MNKADYESLVSLLRRARNRTWPGVSPEGGWEAEAHGHISEALRIVVDSSNSYPCAAPGCTNGVIPGERGRRPRFCSPVCTDGHRRQTRQRHTADR